MSLAKKSTDKSKSKLITLKSTRHIQDQDLHLPKWEFIQEEYNEAQTELWVTKAMVSIFNSILYQERIFFCLSKRSVRDLLKSDKNWNKSIGLKDSNYVELIQALTNSDIIKLIDDTGRAHVYQVISPELLQFLTIDANKQKSEALQFVMEGTTKGTRQGTRVGNREREGEGEREVEREVEREEKPLPISKKAQEVIEDFNLDTIPEDLTNQVLEAGRVAAEVREIAEELLTAIPVKLKNRESDEDVFLDYFETLREAGCDRNSSKVWKDELKNTNILAPDFFIKQWAKLDDVSFLEKKKDLKDRKEIIIEDCWITVFKDSNEAFEGNSPQDEMMRVNGMSKLEYRKLLEYSGSFPSIDVNALPERTTGNEDLGGI